MTDSPRNPGWSDPQKAAWWGQEVRRLYGELERLNTLEKDADEVAEMRVRLQYAEGLHDCWRGVAYPFTDLSDGELGRAFEQSVRDGADLAQEKLSEEIRSRGLDV